MTTTGSGDRTRRAGHCVAAHGGAWQPRDLPVSPSTGGAVVTFAKEVRRHRVLRTTTREEGVAP